jgi:hypothetical protein
MQSYRSLLVGGFVLAFVAAMPARGDTTLTGHHDSNGSGDQNGYDTSSGNYDIPADIGGTPSATFDSNLNMGILVSPGTTLNMAGGEVRNNHASGIYNDDGTVNITGGVISGNDAFALVNNGGTINIYGTFTSPALTPGQVQDVTSGGTVAGTLENDSSPFSFIIQNNSNVYLYDVVPEPASVGLLMMGAAGLLARRRRWCGAK